jgi:hypothetical protein
VKKNKGLDIAVFTILVSFLIAYFGISWYSRPVLDDLLDFYTVRHLGFLQAEIIYYKTLEGSYAGYAWRLIIDFINHDNTHVIFVNLFSITLFFLSLFLLLQQIVKKLMPFYSAKAPFYLSVFCITSILFFRIDVLKDAVFWLIGSQYYFSSVSFLLSGLYFLLKKGTVNYILSAVLLFLFASVRAHYSVIELGILFYFTVWCYFKSKKDFLPMVLIMAIVLVGFAFYLVAPGNSIGHGNGLSQVKQISNPFIFYSRIIAQSLFYYFKIHILRRLPLFALTLSLAFIAGLRDEKNVLSRKMMTSFAYFSIYTIVISWVFLATVMAVALQNAGNARTFFLPLFISLTLLTINCYFLGVQLKHKCLQFSLLALPVGLTASVFFLYFFFSDLGNLRIYNVQYDKRIETIAQAKKNLTSKDTLYLERLPFVKSLQNNEYYWDFYAEAQERALKLNCETAYQIKLLPAKKPIRWW